MRHFYKSLNRYASGFSLGILAGYFLHRSEYIYWYIPAFLLVIQLYTTIRDLMNSKKEGKEIDNLLKSVK